MSPTTELYFECHVTIDPVFYNRLDELKRIATMFDFRVAELIMKKDSEDPGLPNINDSFLSARSQTYMDIACRMTALCANLREAGFRVRRYKIENTLMDSKIQGDVWKLLPRES